jgi:hypothetical protein
LRKNVIPGTLRLRDAQESDCKEVIGGGSVRRTPVNDPAGSSDGAIFDEKASKSMCFETWFEGFRDRKNGRLAAVNQPAGEPSMR